MSLSTKTNRGSAILYVVLCLSLLLLVILEFATPSKQLVKQTRSAHESAKTFGSSTIDTEEITNEQTGVAKTQNQIATSTATSSQRAAAPTSPPVKTASLAPNPLPKALVQPIIAKPIPITSLVPIETINLSTRKALVNIICTAKNSGIFKPVSGSGVIIDPRGIILTNAHLANVLLLKDYPTPGFIDCIVRTGSPARNTYRAELLYISSTWVRANKKSIIEENPTGTGENDFAMLRITEMVDGIGPLPTIFPFVEYELDENSIQTDQPVLIVAYPASFLGGITIQKDLHITSTASTISKLYTFDQIGLLDLISVGTNILAQKGSSGGAVVRQQSTKLTGLIVTSSSEESTGERELNAITIAHINRSLKEEMGFDLATFFSTDLAAVAHDFQTIVAPGLTEILVEVVEQ